MEKSNKYMAYLVARGHSPKKVTRTFENVGKMQERWLNVQILQHEIFQIKLITITRNKNPTCRIVENFIDDCNDPHLPFKYLGFLIIDVLNYVDDLSQNDVESLLFQNDFGFGLLNSSDPK